MRTDSEFSIVLILSGDLKQCNWNGKINKILIHSQLGMKGSTPKIVIRMYRTDEPDMVAQHPEEDGTLYIWGQPSPHIEFQVIRGTSSNSL